MTCTASFLATLPRQTGLGSPPSSMYAPVKSKRKYRFGRFESDSAKGELTHQGARVRLQQQPFRLLTILLEHAGEVISREELRQKL
jgi:DNA-binding winged helix-turn-helix (wHTH) protein